MSVDHAKLYHFYFKSSASPLGVRKKVLVRTSSHDIVCPLRGLQVKSGAVNWIKPRHGGRQDLQESTVNLDLAKGIKFGPSPNYTNRRIVKYYVLTQPPSLVFAPSFVWPPSCFLPPKIASDQAIFFSTLREYLEAKLFEIGRIAVWNWNWGKVCECDRQGW